MALTGSQKAYLQARSGIARSAAIRSNYVFPLFGVITVGGVDLTKYIQYGSLRVTQQLNEEPDTASFDVRLTDGIPQTTAVIGRDVLISLGGPTDNVIFGGRILTTQTTRAPARGPSLRSVLCADYLQVLDSEYLITYGWPAQSASVTIPDLFARFTQKDALGVAISMAAVAPDLPSHAAFTVSNEKFSTVLRRLVTMFATGGGFYIDPLKVLHVWQGTSEPNVQNPQPLTIDLPTLKLFADAVDGSQQRDAVLVEGRRTTAPLGLPAGVPMVPPETNNYEQVQSIPVNDASIGDPVGTQPTYREVRIGSQRVIVTWFIGRWYAPPETPQSTLITADVPFDPMTGPSYVVITVQSTALLTNRWANYSWVQAGDQYLKVLEVASATQILVPRTGFGALLGPIKADTNLTNMDSLGSLGPTRRYRIGTPEEPMRAQPIDADVVMTVRSQQAPAIHEHLVQDGRYGVQGATNRGQQELTDFAQPTTAIDFETEDLNAKPGRLVTYSFEVGDPIFQPTTGSLMILSTEITWPVWGQPPRMRCHAAAVSTASVTDTWLTDQR